MAVTEDRHEPVPYVRRAMLLAAGAAAAWLAQLLVSYALVPWSCRIGSDVPLHLVTALALAATTGCTLAGVRLGQRWDDERPDDAADASINRGVRAAAPMRWLAPAIAGYFTFVVALTGFAPAIVDRCA